MDIGRELGTEPGFSTLVDPLQPAKDSETCPDQGMLVPLPEVLRGINSSADAEDARRLLENLQRRAADQRLRDELARHDFAGPQYRRFQEELARYGTAVLRAWMYSGYVFKLTAARGFHLHPTDAELEELARDSDARDELANITVATALPWFRDHALAGGGWRLDGGAGIATYFMGACLYKFPNEFRRRRVEDRKWHRQNTHGQVIATPETDPAPDPATLVTGNIHVAECLKDATGSERIVVAMTLVGYSQEEIAEVIGRSVRAVEGILHRWRTKEKRSREGGVH